MDLPIIKMINPFAKFFRNSRLSDDKHKDDVQKIRNAQGYSQEELDMGMRSYMGYNYSSFDNVNGYGINSIAIQFEQYFKKKFERIYKYREMSYYPDINDALDMICDESICEDAEGDIISLNIKEELPEYIEDELKKYWDYLIHDVFSFNDTGWELFKRWLVDSELYIELVLNEEGDNIVDFKILPPQTVTPVYSNAKVVGYVQTADTFAGTNDKGSISKEDVGNGYSPDQPITDDVKFDRDQVVYSNYGETGRTKLDVRGFLDSSIRLYNQLKNLEDAVVVYRIVRAPERRIWNVAVGKTPKGKAEQYIKGLIQRYRKNVYYDSTTGAMDSAQNFQAMIQDFWFAKDETGEGTSVETLAPGQNLGEMNDIYYFQKKLLQALKLPRSRWGITDDGSDNTYLSGKGGEITREEIQFSRFVERLRKKFSTILMDAFLTLLRLRGMDEVYIDENLFQIKFVENNLFRQYKELEILEARFGILGAIDTYIYRPEENENGWFSKEFVLKNWFLMSEDEYKENQNLLNQEKESVRLAAESQGITSDEEEDEDFGDADEDTDDFGGDIGGGGGDFDAGIPDTPDEDEDFGATPDAKVGEFDAE